MGMFDTLQGICPKCGSVFESQTKLGPCILGVFKVGDVTGIYGVKKLSLKEPCPNCGIFPTAVFNSKSVLKKFEIGDSDRQEMIGGLTIPSPKKKPKKKGSKSAPRTKKVPKDH